VRKVATVVSFERDSDGEWVHVDLGGGNTTRAQWITPGGDDCPPQAGDSVALIPNEGKGTYQAIGTTDATTKEASSGGKRLYARDENGLVVGYVWAKTDGSIQAGNANAMIQISPAGVISLLGDDVRLCNDAGRKVACLGDAVVVAVPILLSTAPPNPVAVSPPVIVNPDGTIPAVGRIVSGSSKVKAD